jgi:Sigma-70, region 4
VISVPHMPLNHVSRRGRDLQPVDCGQRAPGAGDDLLLVAVAVVAAVAAVVAAIVLATTVVATTVGLDLGLAVAIVMVAVTQFLGVVRVGRLGSLGGLVGLVDLIGFGRLVGLRSVVVGVVGWLRSRSGAEDDWGHRAGGRAWAGAALGDVPGAVEAGPGGRDQRASRDATGMDEGCGAAGDKERSPATRRLIDFAAGPAATATQRAEAAEVRRAMDDLTEDQRDILIRRFVLDQSLEDVAAGTGRRVGAIKSMQHRALATLARRLPGREMA